MSKSNAVVEQSTGVAAPNQQSVQTVATASLVQSILDAAKDPSIDINKLERLMAMRTQLVNEDQAIAFSAAMAAAQREIMPVVRDANNSQTKSRYARLEAINKSIMPVITKHGFAMSFNTDQSPLEKHYRVTCILSHVSGHSQSYHVDIPVDIAGPKGEVNKTPTHAFGSSMSYGRRYLVMLIFNIATQDDDDGNAADRNQKGTTRPPSGKLVNAFKKCASMGALERLWKSLTPQERKQCAQLKDEQKQTIAEADANAASE